MPRPPLYLPTPCIVEVTVRTVQGRPLFPPTRQVRERVNGVLGRALQLYPIDMHLYTFMPNHRHTAFGVGDAAAYTEFHRYVNKHTAEIARDVTGWNGPVWEMRSRPIPILDAEAAISRFIYILSNSVKEGFVDTPFDWPGASCAAALCTTERVEAFWRGPTSHEPEPVPIDLKPLPCWQALPREERIAKVLAICNDITAAARVARNYRPSLGIAPLLRQDPTQPIELERTGPRPLAFASDPATLASYERAYRAFEAAYRESSAAFRRGQRTVTFPTGAILPVCTTEPPPEAVELAAA